MNISMVVGAVIVGHNNKVVGGQAKVKGNNNNVVGGKPVSIYLIL